MQRQVPREREEEMSTNSRCTCHNTLVVKDLNRWFKEKWVDVSRRDKDGKHPPCGRSKAKLSGKGYPKCRPSVKVSSKTPKTSGSMSSGQKRAATKRKRSKRQGIGGKPTIVKSNPKMRHTRELALENFFNTLLDPSENFYYRYPKDDPRVTLGARDKRRGVLIGASGRQYESPEHREAIEGGGTETSIGPTKRKYADVNDPRLTPDFYTPPKPPVNPNVDEPYDEMYNEFYNVSTGEPMDIAFRLLKRELSPEARRHKLEYDTKYESSPERVKYREELNQERRRRGIYGSGDHKDVSHTQGGRLTLEGEHANRARHFKNRGTLRVVKSKQTTLSEFAPSRIEEAHLPHKYPTMTIGTKPGATNVSRERAEELSNQMLAELAGLKLPEIISAEGGSRWTEGGDTEPSFTIPRVNPEQQAKLLELAAKYGQEAVMFTSGQRDPSFRNPLGEITEQYQSSSITPKKPDYYTNYPGSNLYQTLE